MKAGDQIYLNGANFRVDRKVSLELLNKAKFILEDNLLPAKDVDNPLKQLYFAIQLMIINAESPDEARKLFQGLVKSLLGEECCPSLRRLIGLVSQDVAANREYNALKTIRRNF